MMRMIPYKTGILSLVLSLGFTLSATHTQAQLIDGHAYMVGDYVEVGISENGHEGAPCIDDVHCTHPTLFGFVANPSMDGWIEINGDFFVMGSPESGFGLEYTVLGENYTASNNAVGLNEIDGSITSFVESTDSIITTWVGTTGDLELTIIYELKKDEHFYTTSMSVDNLGTETFTDVYYYRNLDPDNNQSSGWSYVTENEIMSQSEMDDDSVIVRASQFNIWDSEVFFHAYGPEWKGFIGGFANRDGSNMWNGVGGLNGDEGAMSMADQAVGVAYKIETLLPGKAVSDVFSFATVFKRGVVFAEEEPDTHGLNELGEIEFKIYPNPNSNNVVELQIEGAFNYSIIDLKGSSVMNGSGNGTTQIDLNETEKGIYLIRIQQEEKAAAVEKLILR